MNKLPKEQLLAGLRRFSGSEQLWRHRPVPILYTDGVQWLAEHAECYWLIDLISSHQLAPAVRAHEFQLWKLRRDEPGGYAFTCTCEDGNGGHVVTQRIEFSDFPLDSLDLYFTGNTLLLPGEY